MKIAALGGEFLKTRVARKFVVLFTMMAILSSLSMRTTAQTTSATISGLVTDSSGAVVADAEVQLQSVERGSAMIAKTNNAGLYVFASVQPGQYQIRVQKQGFKQVDSLGLIANVQDHIEQNFRLQVGSVSESVTVEANGLNINTTDGSVSTVVDRQFLGNIPLNGRTIQPLIALTPGAVMTQASGTEQGQFSINGQRADANYFTVDGVSANVGSGTGGGLGQFASGSLPGFSAQGGTNSIVSVDAIQEFRIQTSSFAPEFGRTPGGQISVVTRAGTNQFHGVIFDYFRNEALDANDWFANHTGSPKPAERQNDFGGVFSGPILKNRTFFFFSYEGLRLRLPKTQLTTVPSTGTRQSSSAAMQPFLEAFPIPNGADLGSGLAQFNSTYSDPSTLDAYSIRVDHTISSRLSLFGRYNFSPSRSSQRGFNSNLSDILVTAFNTHTMTIGLTAAISPITVNELRLNYSNLRANSKANVDNFGGAAPPLAAIVLPPGFSAANSIFALQIGFVPGSPALQVGKTAVGEQRQVNLVDNFSRSVGVHRLKFGVDYRRLAPFDSPLNYFQQATFASMASAIAATPVSSVFIQSKAGDSLLIDNVSLYGQDTWRINSRLGATYGVRWDVNPPPKGNTPSNDPFTVQGLDNPKTMTLAAKGSPLYHTRYSNVAPRLGIAYQAVQTRSWEMVFRGGFGIFYDLGAGSLGNVTSGFPYAATKFLPAATFPLTPQQADPPSFSLSPPVSLLNVADPNLKVPRTYEWNIALEQALGAKNGFSLTYVGASGRDLLRSYTLFSPNPVFTGQVGVLGNLSSSNYQSFQAQFQRRVSRGLQALASYTWSHSIDNASRDSEVFSPPSVGSINADKGDSDFDVRHNFTSAVTYEIPAPARLELLRPLLKDWGIDTLFIARSSMPVDIVGSTSLINGTFFNARPNLVVGQPLYLFGDQIPGGKAFNKAAFAPATAGAQGDFGRNVLRGFGAAQLNFAMRRQFHLTEQVALQFRAELFNLLNHPDFGNPINTSIANPQFGVSTQTLAQSLGAGGARGGLNPLYQIGGPRSTQFAIKLQF